MSYSVFPEPQEETGTESYAFITQAGVYSSVADADDISTVDTTLLPLTDATTITPGIYENLSSNGIVGGWIGKNSAGQFVNILGSASATPTRHAIEETLSLSGRSRTTWQTDRNAIYSGTGQVGRPLYNDGYILVPYNRIVSTQSKGYLAVSTNGTSWTEIEPATDGASVTTAVGYINGRYVVSNSDNFITYSTDLITWSTGTTVASTLRGFASNGTRINGISNNNPARILTSTDGINWTSRASNLGQTGRNIRYVNGIYYAMGNSSSVSTSTDGLNWTQATMPFGITDCVHDVSYGNGYYVMVSRFGNVNWSTDGFNWSTEGSLSRLANDNTERNFYLCLFNKGRFVISGKSDTVVDNKLFTSTDGQNWTDITPVTTSTGYNTSSLHLHEGLAIPDSEPGFADFAWLIFNGINSSVDIGGNTETTFLGGSRMYSSRTIKGKTSTPGFSTLVKIASGFKLNATPTS